MGWLPDKYQPLRDLVRRGDVDADLQDEMTHHLEAQIEANLAAGMTPEQAEAQARQRFGDVTRYRREAHREDRSHRRSDQRRESFTVARQEIRRAWRSLRRTPSFSLVAVMTLAVGIAASVAVFTVLDAIVLRPLPYPAADRLVRIMHPVPKIGPGHEWNISIAEFELFQREARSLAVVALYGNQRLTVSIDDQANRINAGMVSAGALPLLGASPLLGRLLVESDNDVASPTVVVLSEPYWRSRFGGAPDVVGASIRIEGATAEIVGVVAGNVALPDWPVDLWVPQRYQPGGPPHNSHVYRAIARLTEGATPETVSRELAALAAGYIDRFPTVYSQRFMENTGFTTRAVPWKDTVVGEAPRTLWVLFAASILVLLIAAANVANLFLVRSQTLRREVAVRALLGANRRQLAWHHFAEAILVAGAGLLVGLGLAWGGLRMLVAGLPNGAGPGGVTLPRLTEVVLDGHGVGFAAAVALLAGLAFVVIQFTIDPKGGEAVRAAQGTTPSRRENATRHLLVVTQVAVAMVLLAAAGLLIRSLQSLRNVNPGFDPSGVMVADLALPFNEYRTYDRTTEFYRLLTQRLEELPSIQVASVGSVVPLEAEDGCSVFDYPDRDPSTNVACILNAIVGPGYFTALGIKLDGRDLTWADIDGKTGGMLISDALARRIFPDGRVLDRAVNGPSPRTGAMYRVVGMTQDLRWEGLDRLPVEVGYFPIEAIPGTWLWSPPARMRLIVKVSGGSPLAVMPEIRRLVREIDPGAAVENPRTMDDIVTASMRRVSVLMLLLGISAAAALFLSVIGLYGVIAYTVARRTREIGVRIAIGAPAGSVRRTVVRQSLMVVAAGIGIGLLGTLVMGRLLASFLVGVAPNDPVTLIAVVAVLAAVAVVASLRPAMRAAAIDPVVALRSD